MDAASWWTQLVASNAPALPPARAMQLFAALGWALVLALLGAVVASRLSLRARRYLAAALVLWTLLPGPLSPSYWLGLAFQAPSLSAALLSLGLLQRLLFRTADTTALPAASEGAPQGVLRQEVLLAVPVLLGYGLLLDAFAMLPLQLYAGGYSPVLLLVLLLVSLLPWVLRGSQRGSHSWALWVAPMALLLFAATRLPSGNVWDALLDPWLWLVLQGAWLHRLYRRWF